MVSWILFSKRCDYISRICHSQLDFIPKTCDYMISTYTGHMLMTRGSVKQLNSHVPYLCYSNGQKSTAVQRYVVI